MKNIWIKRVCFALAFLLLCCAISVSASAETTLDNTSLSGSSLPDGWYQRNGLWHFRENGQDLTGWQTIGGVRYYMNDRGEMQTGWVELDWEWYYFRSSGAMVTGWLQQGNHWYYLNADGIMAVGPTKVGNYNYFFNEDGVMQTGWIKYQYFFYLDTYLYYYAGNDGVLKTGWTSLNGSWYYFYKDGHLAVNTYIGNYYVDASGKNTSTVAGHPIVNYHAGCTAAQANQADAIARQIAQDALANGGDTDYHRVNYAVDKLHSYYNNNTYNEASRYSESIYGLFVEHSASHTACTLAMARVLDYMDIDWQIVYGYYPYLCFMMDGEYGYAAPLVQSISMGFASGPRVAFGNCGQEPPYFYDYTAKQPENIQGAWVKEAAGWFLLDPNGNKLTGWQYIGDTWYYLKQSGVMHTGWLNDGGIWYYFSSSGAMKTGWLNEGGNWYYLQKTGEMATGTFKANGEFYRADVNGKMYTGWTQENSKWYYSYASGVLARGAATVGGTKYYFNEIGVMATGWYLAASGDWYYAATSGALATGWKNLSGKYYYFYKDGHMAEKTFIDNYFINENGVWESTVSVNRDPQHYKHLTSAQARQADAIAQQIARDALANGGDTDFEKISYAAQIVASYVDQCYYMSDSRYYYRSPYGVFVAGVYTCAGSTRAMGRVLEFMGYDWYHPGENLWDHQWVCVKMDGEYGWVEPQGGFCGFGNYDEAYLPPA